MVATNEAIKEAITEGWRAYYEDCLEFVRSKTDKRDYSNFDNMVMEEIEEILAQ